jgi:hypothetical protein
MAPKLVLRELEERIRGLRARLQSCTFEENLGAVQDILGGERFEATKLEKGWKLRARASSVAARILIVGKSQRVLANFDVPIFPSEIALEAIA